MSLRVWLPLTKDLRNQGLDDVTVNGGTIDNNGKLGKCYLVSKTSPIVITQSVSTTSEWTINFWVKLPSSMNNATAWEQMFVFPTVNADTGDNGSSTINWASYHNVKIWDDAYHQWFWASPGTHFNYDKWHMWTIAHTANGSGVTGKIYIDGNLIGTYNNTTHQMKIRPGNIIIGSGISTGGFYINDFRLYDHCLSPMEVKEISKGLVLHYPLKDKWCETVTNKAGTGFSGWNNSGAATRTSNDTTIPNPPTPGPVGSMIITTAGNCAVQIGTTATSGFASKTLTFSIWVWLGQTQDSNTIYIRSLKTDGNIGNFEYNGSTNPSTWPKEKWLYLTKTITAASDATGFYICTYQNVLNQKRAFNGWQVEEGSHANPWTAPGTTRAASTVEYDCSGFCNNGTRIGTFSWTSDTPKYNASTKFPNNCNTWIVNIDFPQITKNLTFACWCKIQQGSNSSWSFIVSQGRDNSQSGFNLVLNGTEYAVHGSFGALKSGVTVDNTWKHLIGTYDGTTVKIYINGELKNSMAYTSDLTYTYAPAFVIGKMAYNYTSTSSYFPVNGLVSDVRIYTTALSADDVKSLYNNSAYIDNQGNIYGAVYEEV